MSLTSFTPLHFVLAPFYSPLCLCNNSFATFACTSCSQKLVFTASCSFFHCSVFSHTSCYAELVAVIVLYTFLYTNRKQRDKNKSKTQTKTKNNNNTLKGSAFRHFVCAKVLCNFSFAALCLPYFLLCGTLSVAMVLYTFCFAAFCLLQKSCTLSALQHFVSKSCTLFVS